MMNGIGPIKAYVYGSYGTGLLVEHSSRWKLVIYVPKGGVERTAVWIQRNRLVGCRIEVRAIRWWMRPILFVRPVLHWRFEK